MIVAKRRELLRHPRERQPVTRPLERYRGRPDPELEDEVFPPRRNHAFRRQRERAADGRMACHRQFVAGRENPHRARRMPRRPSPGAGKMKVLSEKFISAGNRLHLGGRQRWRLRKDSELVAFERRDW